MRLSDPYEIVGVTRTATDEDIRKAYRKLAKTLNPGDVAAEERFKQLAGAYDLLSDPDKRARYDAGEIDGEGNERPQRPYYRDFSNSGFGPYGDGGGYADFSDGEDIFADPLRRQARARANRPGQDMHYTLAVSLSEAIGGTSKRLHLATGDTLDVSIPAGIADGKTLRLKGKGAPGVGAGSPGDALIEVEVEPDPRFERDGDDLLIEIPISLTEAVEGSKIRVPTPTGEVSLTIPANASSGTRLRLKGQGVPRGGGTRGDQYVRLRIMLPKSPDHDLQAFVATWQAGRSFDPRREAS